MSDELIRAEFEKIISKASLSRGKYLRQDYDSAATQFAWEMWQKCWPIAFAAGLESRPTPEQSGEARDALAYTLECAVENMRLAGELTESQVAARWRLASKLAAYAQELRAAMDRSALGRDAENTPAITANSAENVAQGGRGDDRLR